MTVKEFIGTLESSDRLRIIEGKAEVYVGYLALAHCLYLLASMFSISEMQFDGISS